MPYTLLSLDRVLVRLLPGLIIDEKVKPSGQRVVYYGHFEGVTSNPKHEEWGNIVIKATQELAPTQIAYLQKEIELLNSINSRFYPKLLYNEVFTEHPDTEEKLTSRLFVTIEERIDAIPLSACTDRFSDEKAVCGLIIQLVEALSLLWEHERKIVHRDLKPDNILIKTDDSVIIIDLGIIREEGSVGLTNSLAPWGPCTPRYASPEQAKNDKRNISFKSDFFSLGIIAYELLTGQNPFITSPDVDRHTVLDNVINLKPKSTQKLGKSSESFSNLLDKMMAKEPYQRFRTLDSLKNALFSIQEGIK